MSVRRSPHSRRPMSGAVLVEIVIGLPVMLGLVFIFIGLGSLINARETLSSAVGNGMRLARTRGDPIRLRGEVRLQTLATPGTVGAGVCAAQEQLLRFNTPSSQQVRPFELMAQWNSGIFPLLTNGNCEAFAGFFPYYYYLALAYTYESMRGSISGVRYPCSPPSYGDLSALGEAPVAERRGCLRCVFLNPTQPGDSFSNQTPYGTGLLVNEPHFGMRCDYAPDELSIRLALTLLGGSSRLVGAGGADTATDVLSVTVYSSVP